MTRAGSARSSPAEWLVGATLRSTTEGPRADAERTRRYAAELVTLAPDVILAVGAAPTASLQQATRSFLSFSRCSLIRWAQVWLHGPPRTAHLAIEKTLFPLGGNGADRHDGGFDLGPAITIRAASLVALE
jgi:hypothetical protein